MPVQQSLPFLAPEKDLDGVQRMKPLDFGNINSYPRVISAYESPAQASVAERLFLFAFVVARQPARVLEIGFRFGGTSFLMACALKDCDGGRLVSVDPMPEPALDFAMFGEKFVLLRGSSPAAVPEAVEILGGPVELCFIDGNHEFEAVRADLEAVLPHMAPDSYVMLHDANYHTVARAVNSFIDEHRSEVFDCGLVVPHAGPGGWAGIRLLRIQKA